MPNRIDDYVPYRMLLYAASRLREIGPENGYNTNPAVHLNAEDWENSQAKYRLYVDVLVHDGSTLGLGQNQQTQPRLSLVILGSVAYETEHPRRLALALEQDVRTAIHSDITSIRDTLGRGADVRFEACTHDGGILSPKKLAGFRLELSFTWSQSATW